MALSSCWPEGKSGSRGEGGQSLVHHCRMFLWRGGGEGFLFFIP